MYGINTTTIFLFLTYKDHTINADNLLLELEANGAKHNSWQIQISKLLKHTSHQLLLVLVVVQEDLGTVINNDDHDNNGDNDNNDDNNNNDKTH